MTLRQLQVYVHVVESPWLGMDASHYFNSIGQPLTGMHINFECTPIAVATIIAVAFGGSQLGSILLK